MTNALCKTNRAVRVMWRCYKPAYTFYKVIQKKVTVGIFVFGFVQKSVVWQRNYMAQKEKQDIQRTLYGASLQFLLCFLCCVQNSDERNLN